MQPFLRFVDVGVRLRRRPNGLRCPAAAGESVDPTTISPRARAADRTCAGLMACPTGGTLPGATDTDPYGGRKIGTRKTRWIQARSRTLMAASRSGRGPSFKAG